MLYTDQKPNAESKECDHNNFDSLAGQIVCLDCGQILDEADTIKEIEDDEPACDHPDENCHLGKGQDERICNLCGRTFYRSSKS
ncbi:MAG: hypothetical protein CVT49_12340 [candidate division Zixibacteria bacterium HGW-Zixibacteria-1]|nr:MAG: hypothetical protein CVT49_12340 [candidate division Zixibacteria bacterium HGW-Zixibacteria-1]